MHSCWMQAGQVVVTCLCIAVCCMLPPCAMPQLFLGDTNRTISETPMNQASSRSHCIFSIMLEARQAGSDVVRRSKLHLVDLAGSERVAKSGAERGHACSGRLRPCLPADACCF